MTERIFKENGFKEDQIIKRRFEFSDFYSTTLIKLIMTINLVFNLILILFAYIHFTLTFILIAILVSVVILIIRGLKHPEIPGFWGEYFGEFHKATNVFVKIPAKDIPEDKAGNLVISAHLDSKSQSFNTFWRVVFYKIWVFGGIIFFLFYFLYLGFIFANLSLYFHITAYGAWITYGLVAVSNLFLLFLNTQNKSFGALDNASGMAVVFELSKYLLNNPLDNFNVWCCQFSAEELGTMGSRFFANDHDDIFRKGNVFQINFDLISCKNHQKNKIQYFKSHGVIIHKKLSPLISKYIELAAKENSITVEGFHLSTGAHSDTVPFHLRHFDAIDITTKAAALFTHTAHDTPDKVDPLMLLNTCDLIRHTILLIDNDYYMLCKNNEVRCDKP